jgi:predicted translin family RNA/ssDNA-binding protein
MLAPMLDKTHLSNIKRLHASVLAERRALQGISSDILGAAKRSIFATQRGDAAKAARERTAAGALVNKGKKLAAKHRRLESEGMWRAALEEYAEAALYADAMRGQKIGRVAGLPDDSDVFIGALSDLTGELTRSCVLAATERNRKEVDRLLSLVREAVEFLLQLDLTGQSRQKFDQAKQNLRKIEEIAFNLSVHGEKR